MREIDLQGLEELVRVAEELGCDLVRIINVNEIRLDDVSKNETNPVLKQEREVFREALPNYHVAILVKIDKEQLRVVRKIEMEAHRKGYYFALALTNTKCDLCEQCQLPHDFCRYRDLYIPSMHSLGLGPA